MKNNPIFLPCKRCGYVPEITSIELDNREQLVRVPGYPENYYKVPIFNTKYRLSCNCTDIVFDEGYDIVSDWNNSNIKWSKSTDSNIYINKKELADIVKEKIESYKNILKNPEYYDSRPIIKELLSENERFLELIGCVKEITYEQKDKEKTK